MENSSLAAFQKAFMDSILKTTPFLYPAKAAKGANSVDEVVSVHREGYFARLIEALGETYEGVWSILGGQLFFNIATAFIRSNPSSFYNLATYGKEFPEYLEKNEELQNHRFLYDLARYEWKHMELFHAPPPKLVESSMFEQLLENPTLQIIFNNSFFLFSSDHPISKLYEMKNTQMRKIDFDLNTPEYTLTFKVGHQIKTILLSESLFYAIEKVIKRQSLGALLDDTSYSDEVITQALQTIASTGLVTQIN